MRLSSDAGGWPIPDFGDATSRTRLLGLFSRIKPRAVLISGPAAAGKSVLAAQASSTPRFHNTRWVELEGRRSGPKAVLLEVLQRAAGDSLGVIPTGDVTSGELGDLATAVVARLDILPGSDTCLILDNCGIDNLESYLVVSKALHARDSGIACVVFTTRLNVQPCYPVGSTLVIEPDDLLLDLAESRRVARQVLGLDIKETALAQLMEWSGGQAGLFVVLAKGMASSCAEASSEAVQPGRLRSALKAIADAHLAPDDRRLLHCMCILGCGSANELTRLMALEIDASRLLRIASMIPLVHVADDYGSPVFQVQAAAQDALVDERAFARDLPDTWRALLQLLSDRGDGEKALRLAVTVGDEPYVTYWLEQAGEDALLRGHRALLRKAFTLVSSLCLVDSPRLLLLKASLEWEDGLVAQAATSASIALDVAQHKGDQEVLGRVLLILALITAGNGDLVLARDYLERARDAAWRVGAQDTLWDLTGRLLLTNALLGDIGGFDSAYSEAERLLARDGAPEHSSESLKFLAATSRAALFGSWAQCLPVFESASHSPAIGLRSRVAAAHNHIAALIETGRLSRAEAVLGELATAIGTSPSPGEINGLRSLEAGLLASRGDGTYSVALALECADSAWSAGEGFAAVLGLVSGASASLACGARDDALTQTERAMAWAERMEAPALARAAHLEHAASMLALGDTHFAARKASRIHDEVSGTGAAYHHLKADLILAEVDCRASRQDAATERLREHVDYILSESPNWLVAMYTRAFPSLLGPVAAAVGAANLPVHMLNMILPTYAEQAVEAARGVVSDQDFAMLSARLLGDRAIDHDPSDVPVEHCEVRLFGGLQVRVGERVVEDRSWRKRKARILFAMLCTRCGKDVPRDQIIEALWPEMEEDQALNNLYVVWSAMKRALTPDLRRADACPYVEHRGGVCRAAYEVVSTDLDEFDRQLILALRARKSGDADAEIAAVQRIAEIYVGDLLPGETYNDWFAAQRERCRQDFEDAMLRGAILLGARGDPVAGLSLLRKALQWDAWREDLYQASMRLQMAAGQRNAAIDTYFACRSHLIDDLGIDPSAETRRLYDQVLCMEEEPDDPPPGPGGEHLRGFAVR